MYPKTDRSIAGGSQEVEAVGKPSAARYGIQMLIYGGPQETGLERDGIWHVSDAICKRHRPLTNSRIPKLDRVIRAASQQLTVIA